MIVNEGYLFAFLSVFVRGGALLFSAPLFGARNVPALTRVGLAGLLALSLAPLLGQSLGAAPTELGEFVLRLGNEVVAGLLLGLCIQLFVQCLQMAGAFLDVQIGFGTAQLLNPATGTPVSILAQFKSLLALVLLLCANGHLLMIQAFVASFRVEFTITTATFPELVWECVRYVSSLSIVAVQIAAPVTAVCFVVDLALGIVSKAVPQMQVFLVGMPAKVVMGMVAMAVALPLLVATTQVGIERVFDFAGRLLQVGR